MPIKTLRYCMMDGYVLLTDSEFIELVSEYMVEHPELTLIDVSDQDGDMELLLMEARGNA